MTALRFLIAFFKSLFERYFCKFLGTRYGRISGSLTIIPVIR